MVKLRFDFSIIASKDGKSNVLVITSIATENGEIYAIPEELQAVNLHKEIIKTSVYPMVKNSIKKRYQFRKVWIELTDELKKAYIDNYGNMIFSDQILEETTEQLTVATDSEERCTLNKLLEKLIENTQLNEKRSLKKISEKFVIEKFTSKNTNAEQWIDIFEKECIRFDITKDEEKIEILRFFMDKSCSDWYSSMLIKLTRNSEWNIWTTKFCETFANKGWNPVTYALLFKYKDGTLLDYAMKKEKLLLEMRRSIDAGTLIDLIAAGLPEFILNRIDRELLEDTVDLFNKISKYEHMVNKRKNFEKKKNTTKEPNEN